MENADDFWGASNISSNLFGDEEAVTEYKYDTPIQRDKSILSFKNQSIKNCNPTFSTPKNPSLKSRFKVITESFPNLSLSNPNISFNKSTDNEIIDQPYINFINECILHDNQNTFTSLINKGAPKTLDSIKSLKDKAQLLDASLKINECDVLLKNIMFCKNTLTRDNFFALMMKRPKACERYAQYLDFLGEDDIFEWNRPYISEMKSINKQYPTDFEQIINALSKLKSHINGKDAVLPTLNQYISHVQRLYTLSKLDIQNQFNTFLQSHKAKNKSIPTVVDILSYAFQNHDLILKSGDQDLIHLLDPYTMLQEFKISPKLYALTLIKVICKNEQWLELNSAIQAKGTLLHPIRSKVNFGFQFLSQILIIEKVPCKIIEQYIGFIADGEERKRMQLIYNKIYRNTI